VITILSRNPLFTGNNLASERTPGAVAVRDHTGALTGAGGANRGDLGSGSVLCQAVTDKLNVGAPTNLIIGIPASVQLAPDGLRFCSTSLSVSSALAGPGSVFLLSLPGSAFLRSRAVA